jgi:drug/metabolite transporter (DMT)-like permease
MLLAVALALVAACSNAASNVVQRITNRDESDVRTLSLKLVRDLLHRPLWFAGVGFVVLSFLLQASALRFGPLAMVEPLLICELPLTFVGAAVVMHARLGWREWSAAVVMTAGLAALIAFLDPHGGAGRASGPVWLVGLGASGGVVAALVAAGKRTEADRRAAYYGVATGITFGTTAALMKGAVSALSHGMVAIFSTWQTYAMVAAGILGLFLVQNALQAGKIIAAQPGITLADPFVAIVWGIFGFGERAVTAPVQLALAVGGGALMVVGALLLSRSPILERSGGGGGGGDGRRGGGRGRHGGDAGGGPPGHRPGARLERAGRR